MIEDTYTLLELFDYEYKTAAGFLIFIGLKSSRSRVVEKLENLKVSEIHEYIVLAIDLPYSNIKFFKQYYRP